MTECERCKDLELGKAQALERVADLETVIANHSRDKREAVDHYLLPAQRRIEQLEADLETMAQPPHEP